MSKRRRFRSRAGVRRYVLNVTMAMLEHDLTDREGWMFGGIENPDDRKQLETEIMIFVVELLAKTKRRRVPR